MSVVSVRLSPTAYYSARLTEAQQIAIQIADGELPHVPGFVRRFAFDMHAGSPETFK